MGESGLGVAIYVKDLSRQAEYYASLLELEIRQSELGFVVLGSGSVELILVAMAPEWAQAVVITSPPEIREETPIKPLFPVKDIAQTRTRAERLGGRLKESETEWTFNSYRVCDGYDPEGNVFQVRQVRDQRSIGSV